MSASSSFPMMDSAACLSLFPEFIPSDRHVYRRDAIHRVRLVAEAVGQVDTPYCSKTEHVLAYMSGAFNEFPFQEQGWVLLLNRRNRAIGRVLISVGTLTSTVTDSGAVYRAAIVAGAAAIVFVHNHPSGVPEPSAQDITFTRELREASRIIGIQLLDHVIIGDKSSDPLGKGYYSFRDSGVL